MTTTMWTMTVPWWELIARSLIVYIFLLALIRLTGKRQVGQLAPFDLILLLVLSNAVTTPILAHPSHKETYSLRFSTSKPTVMLAGHFCAIPQLAT